MDTLKVGDIVVYSGGTYSLNKSEVGRLVAITPCDISDRMFGSMELLVPKEQPMGGVQTKLTGITAPLRYFSLFKQMWEC